MIRTLARILGRDTAPTHQQIAQERLAADVERRRALVGIPFAKRRAAALKAVRR